MPFIDEIGGGAGDVQMHNNDAGNNSDKDVDDVE